MTESILLLMIFASWIYWIAACWMVRAFFHRRSPEAGAPSFAPPVSILVPVKGLDYQAFENFASFCRQDYPHFEVLFGVADPADPVIPLVSRLQREFPQREIHLVIDPPIGSNRKASLLHSLSNQARHEILVASDSDMRVTPDYLRRVVAPLADSNTGLVTCPYRGVLPLNFTAGLEALHMGVTFLPSVLVARRLLDMRFALGATIAVRGRDLARIGGFASVADFLADDYQVGARIAALGLRVHLSNYVVSAVLGAPSFQELWQRELRWARCNRVSRPWEYPGLLLSFSTPLALVLSLVAGFDSRSWLVLFGSISLRWLVAWMVSGYTGNRELRRRLIWLPVRDLMSALVWFFGGVGRRITWRGEGFLLGADGRMEPELLSAEFRQPSS